MPVITARADDRALSEASAELSAERYLNRYRCPQCHKEITPYASLPVATASSTASLKN